MRGNRMSRVGWAVLALYALIGGCGGGDEGLPRAVSTATVSSSTTYRGLTLTATTRAEYRVKEQIEVTFTVRNETSETITYTPVQCQYLTRTVISSGPAGYLSPPITSTNSPTRQGEIVADILPHSGLEEERTSDRCTDSVSIPPGPTLTTSLAPGQEKMFTFTWDQRVNGYSDYDPYPAVPFPQPSYTPGEFVRTGVYSLAPQLRLLRINGEILNFYEGPGNGFPTPETQKLGPDPLTISILD